MLFIEKTTITTRRFHQYHEQGLPAEYVSTMWNERFVTVDSGGVNPASCAGLLQMDTEIFITGNGLQDIYIYIYIYIF